MKINEDTPRVLWDNINHNNIRIIGIPEGEEKGPEKIFQEIIVKKSPNMGKEIASQVQEAQTVPGSKKPKEKHTKTHSYQIDKN